ncbi:hypothetical protein AVEN_262948-1 [Araneus ventricosus]|uniref:Integrase catalytic domain-containing protein n=1 Tax=Araneus ventricosus TaxID=182803 RepID=A0A4Y2DID9_ARAVE|nr:hypothetical protein AVEN_262948-1 [Araneus ventricosus]
MPILRDTGETVDVISQKFVDYAKMTGEHVWVQFLLNEDLVCLPLAKVEIKCELGHIKTKVAVVTNDPGRYVLGNKTTNLFKDKPFLKLEKINAVMTRSQAKRSSEEDQNKEAEVEQPEEITHFEIDKAILPLADEEYNEIKQLIEADFKEFIESQHQSRDLAPLLNEAKTENSSKPNDFKIKENGMLVKKKIDKNENERELIVIPEKYRDQIKLLCHERKFGIKVTRSSVHHPQSNPVERFHQTIKKSLKVLCIEAAPEWEKQVPAALFDLRTIRHESTGFTPSELVYGRNLRTPVTLLYELWMNPEDEGNYVVEYVFQLINRLKRCKELTLDKMLEMQTKRKVLYDRKALKKRIF